MSATATETAPAPAKRDWRDRYKNKPRPSRATRPHLPTVNHPAIRDAARVDADREVAALRDAPGDFLARVAAAGAAVNAANDDLDRVRRNRDYAFVQLALLPPHLNGLGKVLGVSETTQNHIKQRRTGCPRIPRDPAEQVVVARKAGFKQVRNWRSALAALVEMSEETTRLEVRRDVLAAYRDPLVAQAAAELDMTRVKLAEVVGCGVLRLAQIIKRNTPSGEGSA